jgi:hypothetical protein
MVGKQAEDFDGENNTLQITGLETVLRDPYLYNE